MSDLKAAFELWAWRMRVIEDCPQSEVEQLREEIHAIWDDPEKREYWTQRIFDEAKESQVLLDMSKGITERIKASLREAKNESA